MAGSDKKRVGVIACTDDDMSAGGYILPRDPSVRHKATEAEAVHLDAMFRGFHELKRMGWQEAMYAPRTPENRLLLIEPGSTGIHEGYRDENGDFWVYDGDTWPSRPILWKPLEAPDAA